MLRSAGFALAILAPLGAIAALYAGRFCPLPRGRLVRTAALCALTALVTALASAFLVHAGAAGSGLTATAQSTMRLLAILALLEELSRFVVLGGYGLRPRYRSSARDGIVLGLVAGLTFALLENVMTSMGDASGFSGSGWIRVAMATPLHALLGGLMGYLIVRAQAAPAGGPWKMLLALAAPVAIHIVYDTPVIVALAFWGDAMTPAVAGTAIALSALVDLALAAGLYRLFRAA